jgi:hypothetical protein
VGNSLLFAGGVVLAWGGHRAWRLWRHPFGRCYWCHGRARNPGSTDDEYGYCRHCTGGRRVRMGATIFHPELKGKR